MFEEFINRIDKILPIGGGFGASTYYIIEHGIVLNNINIFINQCIVTFLLAVIGGIGGWLGGHLIKKLHVYLLKKPWYMKLFNFKSNGKKSS